MLFWKDRSQIQMLFFFGAVYENKISFRVRFFQASFFWNTVSFILLLWLFPCFKLYSLLELQVYAQKCVIYWDKVFWISCCPFGARICYVDMNTWNTKVELRKSIILLHYSRNHARSKLTLKIPDGPDSGPVSVFKVQVQAVTFGT